MDQEAEWRAKYVIRKEPPIELRQAVDDYYAWVREQSIRKKRGEGKRMPGTITVKGTGRVTVSPDYVVLTVKLETKNREYDRAMDVAAKQLAQLNDSLALIGFEKEDLKTTKFYVNTEYSKRRDRRGNYRRVLSGFVCSYQLKLSFDFELKRLSQVLEAVTGNLANPELQITFSVKDTEAAQEALLQEVTANARKKAELLCEASGVRLGKMLTINYDWTQLNLSSKTRYEVEKESLCKIPSFLKPINIEPDDIEVSDTAVFAWEFA